MLSYMRAPLWTPGNYPLPSRPVVMGCNGMATSEHPLVSMAGVQVLLDGGNAFDAAVCMAAFLGVVQPYMSGLGGTGVALLHVAQGEVSRVLNFSGKAPVAAEPGKFTPAGLERGPVSPLVPGCVAGWLALHESYGTLDTEALFGPAIRYAENGFPATELYSAVVQRHSPRLIPYESSVREILGFDGVGPRPGERVRRPRLAKSLCTIARNGAEVFYQGEMAEDIVNATKEFGGLLTLGDLASYAVEWQDPISVNYRGYEVYAPPPNTMGFQTLQTLKTVETRDTGDLAFQNIDTIHFQMESSKLSITDRIRYAGDPQFVEIPVAALLSEEYAAEQARRIDPYHASYVLGETYTTEAPPDTLHPGCVDRFGNGMTTSFAVSDCDGNVASITQTLGGFFGSGLAAADTGIFLNNMAMMFDLEGDGPNVIGPGKRPASPLSPTHTYKGDSFFLSIGTPGGWGIPQTTAQFLVNVLDFGMDVQQAIEAPLFRHYVGRDVLMEERFPIQVRVGLEAIGHNIAVWDGWSMRVGGAHPIQFDEGQGVMYGGADPRRDGFAVGY